MQITPSDTILSPPRSQGRAVLAREGGRLVELYQKGCLKILLPRFGAEAVVVNTSGGLTGGDRLGLEIRLGDGEALTVTTQAAERIYRSAGGAARLDQQLTLGDGARLDWLPQETLLYNGAALERRLTATLTGTARFLGVECYLFGRLTHGERLSQLWLRDHWRIWRDGVVIHAEALRLDAPPFGPAELGENRAMASLVLSAPGAADLLDAARARLPAGTEAGLSAPRPDLLIARLLAPEGQSLRRLLSPLLNLLRGAPPPRVWQF